MSSSAHWPSGSEEGDESFIRTENGQNVNRKFQVSLLPGWYGNLSLHLLLRYFLPLEKKTVFLSSENKYSQVK